MGGSRARGGTPSTPARLLLAAALLTAAGPCAEAIGASPDGSRIRPGLEDRFAEAGPDGRVKAWVLFRRDKGIPDPPGRERAIEALRDSYDPRAVRRRMLRRTRPGLFDVDDLPLPERWLSEVRATGATIVVQSRWAHGVSARVGREQLERLAALDFVEEIRPVLRGRRVPGPAVPDGEEAIAGSAGKTDSTADFYGEASPQLHQINVPALHALGLGGGGVRIGVLDTGFRKTHVAFNDPANPLDVFAEWDFLNDDPETGPEPGDIFNQHEHGTLILGVLAAYWPDTLVAGAYEASYILAKVEDVASEYPAEEDMFVAGLEFIEENGGDLATSSVVIFDHYTQQQNDGRTSVMAQGVNTATDNGLHVFQGVGNNGHDTDPATSTLVTPADAFKANTVGSVDLDGTIASFTSDGPTADGRQKPEVMARGVNTRTVSPWLDNATAGENGASLATPLVAGAAACLIQAHPAWTVDQLRTHLFLHGSHYVSNGAPDPLFIQGFGIIDALAAHQEDCNGNGVADPVDLAGGASGDCNGNAIPDECDVEALTSADDDPDGLPDECTECLTGPGCPSEVENLHVAAQPPDLVLTWSAATDVAEYSIRRDETAQGAGTSEVGRVPAAQLTWTDAGAMESPQSVAFYVVRGVTAGGIAGP